MIPKSDIYSKIKDSGAPIENEHILMLKIFDVQYKFMIESIDSQIKLRRSRLESKPFSILKMEVYTEFSSKIEVKILIVISDEIMLPMFVVAKVGMLLLFGQKRAGVWRRGGMGHKMIHARLASVVLI